MRAYRRLAHGAHPDTHPEDPDAPQRFRDLTEAYQVLADPGRRARYDRSRTGAPGWDQPRPPSESARVQPFATSPGRPEGPGNPRLVDLGLAQPRPAPLRAGPVRIDPGPAGPRHRPGRPSSYPVDEIVRLLWRMLGEGWR